MDYARRSMQRLGYLKILIALSSPSSSTTLEGITGRFQRAITKLEPVPAGLHGRLMEYAMEQRRALRSSLKDDLRAQLQDLYLSDPRLPSKSGAITGDPTKDYRHTVYVEVPPWAIGLGLLRNRNYTQTDRGRILGHLDDTVATCLASFCADTNPFILTTAERFFFLFCLLDSDGDILFRLFQRSFHERAQLTRTDVGREIVVVLRELIAGPWKNARGLAARAAAVVKAAEGSSGEGMGPLESLATPRTEPLVDCGILRRTGRTYEYELTEAGRDFVEDIRNSPSLAHFIESSLAGAVTRSVRYPSGINENVIWQRILECYRLLRTGLGYVAIRELALFAVTRQIGADQAPFELDDAVNAITKAPQTWGRAVRLAQSRTRGGGQVRIDLTKFEGKR